MDMDTAQQVSQLVRMTTVHSVAQRSDFLKQIVTVLRQAFQIKIKTQEALLVPLVYGVFSSTSKSRCQNGFCLV